VHRSNDLTIMGASLTRDTVCFYAGLNLIAWFMIFCFVRETKQLTLEEIDRKYRRSIDPSQTTH
jgi:hypothetical protein